MAILAAGAILLEGAAPRRNALTGYPRSAAMLNTPVIGVPFLLPPSIAMNQSTVITIAISIPDSTLIPGSVNVLQLGPTGTQLSLLGVMHDDGQNGDAIAGDHIYTFRTALRPTSIGGIQFEVSAAFQGLLKRLVTSPIALIVTADGSKPIPPDPGSQGRTTLAGIDSDNDGIRDDVERYIAVTYPTSAKMQMALMQATKAYQAAILDASSTPLAQSDTQSIELAIDCLAYVTPSSTSVSDLVAELEGHILNTQARIQAFLAADAQMPTSFDRLPQTGSAQQRARCLVDPNTLPN